MKKIVVLTSGGDAPGMNAAIRSVVRTALHYNIEVFGCKHGYKGLVDQELIPMNRLSVANTIQMGGTVLKTNRCEGFYKQDVRMKAARFLADQKIDGLIVVGGDGSFRGASKLRADGGPPVIGIPATIDNDIFGTDYTIGFDTARNTALQAIDRIRDTASSHDRDFMIEVMGRNTGFLAVEVGIAGGAEFILIPEFDLPIERLAERVKNLSKHKPTSIIVVAEGDKPGRSMEIAEQLGKLTDKFYKVCILGHTQRGGSPTAMDRKYAAMMGYKAVHALIDGESDKMTAIHRARIELAPFPDPEKDFRRFDDEELIKMNVVICH
ncbi:MAG: 6-phosphofructokinase [Gammaproteobacteria bacterium]